PLHLLLVNRAFEGQLFQCRWKVLSHRKHGQQYWAVGCGLAICSPGIRTNRRLGLEHSSRLTEVEECLCVLFVEEGDSVLSRSGIESHGISRTHRNLASVG